MYSGIHSIDWQRWIVGSPVHEVYARSLSACEETDAEDGVVGTWTFANGAQGTLIGNQPGYLYIMDGMTHGIEWKSPLLGTDVHGITAVDLDSDPAIEIIAAQGGYQGKGDYTSGYTTPHIYVIDGETHEIEYTLGEKDYVEFTMQIILLVLIVIFLVEVSVLTKILKTVGIGVLIGKKEKRRKD